MNRFGHKTSQSDISNQDWKVCTWELDKNKIKYMKSVMSVGTLKRRSHQIKNSVL